MFPPNYNCLEVIFTLKINDLHHHPRNGLLTDMKEETCNMQGLSFTVFPIIPLMNLKTTELALEPPEQHTKNP